MEFSNFGRKNIWNMRYKKDSAKQKHKEKEKNIRAVITECRLTALGNVCLFRGWLLVKDLT